MGTIVNNIEPSSNILPGRRIVVQEILKAIPTLPYNEEKKLRRIEEVLKKFFVEINQKNREQISPIETLSELTGLGLSKVIVNLEEDPVENVKFTLNEKEYMVKII